jgi:hypothetical protein
LVDPKTDAPTAIQPIRIAKRISKKLSILYC